MTRSLFTILAAGSLLVSSFSCEDDDDFSNFLYTHVELQCVSPWGSGDTADGNADAVSAYLAGEGIEVLSLTARQSGPEVVCEACSCPTGTTYELEASGRFASRLSELGFVRD